MFDVQLGGIAALHRLRQEFPHQKIVVLADTDDRTAILESLGAGVNGYVLKSTTIEPTLASAGNGTVRWRVRAGRTRGRTPPPTVHLPQAETSPLLAHLTERQIEVFQLLSEGCATKTIARRLGLAVGTVKVHLAAIYRVLGAHSRIEALAKARGGIALPVVARAAELLAA